MLFGAAVAVSGIVGMMALFAWGRLRSDLVAALALFAAIASGLAISHPADPSTATDPDDEIDAMDAVVTADGILEGRTLEY